MQRKTNNLCTKKERGSFFNFYCETTRFPGTHLMRSIMEGWSSYSLIHCRKLKVQQVSCFFLLLYTKIVFFSLLSLQHRIIFSLLLIIFHQKNLILSNFSINSSKVFKSLDKYFIKSKIRL